MNKAVYEDAMDFDISRIDRELDGLTTYMRENWGLCCEANRAALVEEYRALRAARAYVRVRSR